MEGLRNMKAEDQLEAGSETTGGGKIDPSPLLGIWYGTDPDAGGVARLTLANEGGTFTVHAFGVCLPDPCDWGPTEATAFGANILAGEAMAFTANYDFGFMETLLAAYGKQGILVLDTFNTFKDGSGRAAYFTREFFHR